MNTIDLQIQSTASDGKFAPRELVRMAKAQGLSVIAITDHDTIGGLTEALAAGEEFGVRVISGIEISVEEHDAHLLGYGMNIEDVALIAALEEAQRKRIEGAKKMVENLRNAGFVVKWSDVERQIEGGLRDGGVVARPHIARAILGRPENREKLGNITSVHDFIEMHLSNASPHYVRRAHIPARDAIALIHGAGGVAIWSHPAIHFPSDYEGLEQFLGELMEWGIDGIEVLNPSHTEDDVEFLEGLAAEHRVLRTAGSDFHDVGEHARDPTGGLHSAKSPGDYPTYGFLTDDIVARLDEAIEKRRSGAAQVGDEMV